MNFCHLDTQSGVDMINGPAFWDAFDARTDPALEFPNFDLGIELCSAVKPFDSVGGEFCYDENELGLACLGTDGDWLTRSIVLPCIHGEQLYKPEAPATPVEFSSASPESVTSCYADSFELDAVISILGVDDPCYKNLPPAWPPADHETLTPPVVARSSSSADEAEVTTGPTSRKRSLTQCEKDDHTTSNSPAAKNRKKEQNKSAALKYRQKKREEQSRLENRKDKLEEQNQKLKLEVASLEKNVAYLSQLWQELHGKLQT